MAESVGFLRKIPTFAFSLLYTVFVVFGMFKNLFKFGPKKLFHVKTRDIRPAIIDDPCHGTHGFARLKVRRTKNAKMLNNYSELFILFCVLPACKCLLFFMK